MIPGTKKSGSLCYRYKQFGNRHRIARAGSEEKLRSTLQVLDDLVFALDRNGIFIDFTAREGRIIHTPDQFIGKSYRDVLPPQVSLLVEHAIMQVKEDGVYRQIEYDLDLLQENRGSVPNFPCGKMHQVSFGGLNRCCTGHYRKETDDKSA
jgi:PAS domain-containing protein